MGEWLLTALTRQCVFGEQPDGSALNDDAIQIARIVVDRASRHGPVDLYVDSRGRWAALPTRVEYSTRLPDNWLVGRYTKDGSVIRIMEDLELRLTEVRAANG